MTLLFADTNLFVYAIDPADPFKMRRSRDVLEYLLATARGVISAQVVSEFVVATSRRISTAKERHRVAEHGRIILEQWPVVPLSPSMVQSTLDVWESHQISYWDAQICAAALEARCSAIITEDTRDPVHGLRYIDPFAAGFDIRAMGD